MGTELSATEESKYCETAIPSSNSFLINDDELNLLGERFGLSFEHCNVLRELYEDSVREEIPKQHLAHVIRCIELSMRATTKNRNFIVESNKKLFSGKCSIGKYREGDPFRIYLHNELEKDNYKARIVLAHELGHLFMVANAKILHEKGVLPTPNYTEEDPMEPLASLFGFLVMSGKNYFYQNKAKSIAEKAEEHGFDNLIKDFLDLCEEAKS